MNKKILLVVASMLLFLGYSCDSYLDVNHDPNVLEQIPDAKVVLPTAEVALGNKLMGWDFGIAGGFWSEYWTQEHNHSQFKTLCNYEEQSFAGTYSGLTAGVLNDLDKMKAMSKDNVNKGTYFIAEALSIFTWQILTDVWGDVPYFEALKGNEGIFSPKFDKQEVIYKDLFKRIDELLKTDLSKSSFDGKYDFCYNGDLNQWKLFVNSLKLKLMMRLTATPGYDNAKVVNFIKNNEFITKSAMIPGKTWSDNQEGKRHPMREFEAGDAEYLSGNVIACLSFSSYLMRNKDPRMDVFFKAPADKPHKGGFFGDYESKEDTDGNGKEDKEEKYSSPLFKGDMDLMLMSLWEVDFFIAEAYARAGNNAEAKKYYDMGVMASLAQNGITNTDIITATDGYAVWKNGTAEEGVEQIMMQKWVANCNYQHIESFLERNRNKYPKVNPVDIELNRQQAFKDLKPGYFTISVKGRGKLSGKLPSAPIYPVSVISRNENAPAQRVDLLTKVWWNQK